MEYKMQKNRDLTSGSITGGLWAFAVPLMLGNVLQQFYNLADTWVVGKYIGDNALAAVGSSYTLMTFLTSVIIGLSLGTGSFISMAFGRKEQDSIRNGIFMSAGIIGILTLLITAAFYMLTDPIISLLNVPEELTGDMHTYLVYVFTGFFAVFLYNYISNILRGMGNSTMPLIFLGVSVALNVGLDLLFVIPSGMGIMGAALATAIAQYVSGVGVLVYFIAAYPEFRLTRRDMRWDSRNFRSILSLSGFTCLQQSVMNLGILMVQTVVNSFGSVVMAGFSVAVKIDTIAYIPVQDFGNAFSVFTAQNYGAGKRKRIIHSYFISMVFSFGIALVMSALLVIFGRQFLGIFTNVEEVAQAGMIRLRIMGCSYAFSAFMDCTIAANRGLGKSFVPTVIVIMGSCVFRIIWVYTVFAYFHTIESLYLLYIVSWAITAAAEMICLRRVYREQMQKLPPDIDGVKATA